MRIRPSFLLLAAACALAPLARATSVVPPNFPELVAEADAIYRGRVTDIQARRVAAANGQSVIKTFVTITVDRTLKGPEQANVTLEFLGGTIGDEILEVSGMPKYTVGERGIVFVQGNGRQFCPVVRLGHGSYRVRRDERSGREFVERQNRAPLNDVSEVELPLARNPVLAARAAEPDLSRALTPAAFEAAIVREVQTPTREAIRHENER